MIKKFKIIVKKILLKFGYTVVRVKTKSSTKPIVSCLYDKNNLLNHFYSILNSQNYIPTVIYDVGANKGTWTKECLSFFPNATYYLFEPQIILKNEIDSLFHDKSNIKLFTVGVGNINGELDFTIHERDDSCSFRFSEDEARENGFKQMKVPIVRLDNFVEENNLQFPSILKIDAEGLDIEVLQGAEKVIQNTEIILIEVGVMNKKFNNSVLNVLNYLDQIGFRLFDITDINRPFSNDILWLCEFAFIKKGGILDKEYSK